MCTLLLMSSLMISQFNLDLKMASSVARKLIDQKIIRTAAEPQNLYQLLSLLPRDGLGARVAPVSWVTGRRDLTREQQQRPSAVECENYYTITHVHLTPV